MKRLIFLLLVWMIIIFNFSNKDYIKSINTSNKITNIVLKVVDNDNININYSTLVRKTAHVLEFMILSILLLYCLRNYTDNYIIVSAMLCVIYACSDEIHQLFILGRNGCIKDVLIDSIGIILGILVYSSLKKFEKITN